MAQETKFFEERQLLYINKKTVNSLYIFNVAYPGFPFALLFSQLSLFVWIRFRIVLPS